MHGHDKMGQGAVITRALNRRANFTVDEPKSHDFFVTKLCSHERGRMAGPHAREHFHQQEASMSTYDCVLPQDRELDVGWLRAPLFR